MDRPSDPGPRLPPRTLGVGALLLAALDVALGVALLASGTTAGAVTGGCLCAVALIGFVEAGLCFGRRGVERAARLRGAAQLTLVCLIGLWVVGAAWLAVVLAFGRSGAAADLVVYTVLVLLLAMVGALNVAESSRALQAWRATGGGDATAGDRSPGR